MSFSPQPPPPGRITWRRWRRRLPAFLFTLCLALASGLTAVVIAAPFLDGVSLPGEIPDRVLRLFARDVALRRTALASAAGLTVTAFIFFRPPYGRPPRSPTDVVGA